MMKRRISAVLKQAVCILLSIIVIAPFYMVLINSFKGKSEAARMSLSLPAEWLFSNYAEVIEKAKLWQGLGNSLLYALVSTFIGVILSAMAAFVLSRNKIKLNKFLYFFILCGLFFPINYVTLIRVLQFFHLNDTRIGIIITFTGAMILPYRQKWMRRR